jgi:hypothetical protein
MHIIQNLIYITKYYKATRLVVSRQIIIEGLLNLGNNEISYLKKKIREKNLREDWRRVIWRSRQRMAKENWRSDLVK